MPKTKPEKQRGDFLPGLVREEWKRCGKPNCRCANGDPHGPYYRRQWRAGGKLHSEYVSASEVGDVRERCAAWQELRRKIREGHQSWAQVMRQGRALWRLVERG